jgi:HSP20 family molecular chaperone IbpA
MDKSGKGCTVYDIVINPSFLDKTEADPVFMQFFLSIVFDGLEQKYSVVLDRVCTRLKRKKALGQPADQMVRTSKKPLIMEMKSEEKANINNTLIQEVPNEDQKNRAPSPEYVIYREPAKGKPEFMVLEVKLPGVRSSKHFTLDAGEDRVVLETTGPATFYLDIDLAYYVINSDIGAQFNRKTKVLTVTLPVQKT